MKKLKLDIVTKVEALYGHPGESVKRFEALLAEVQEFFDKNEENIKSYYRNIIGIKVSNSGCNVWLQILNPRDERVHNHTIETTQNVHLIKWGFQPRRTDLDRFLN